ncbi:MAG: hypothetical protein ACRCTA_07095 [Bacilli bacterium]
MKKLSYLIMSIFIALFIYSSYDLKAAETDFDVPTTRSTSSYYWWKQDSIRYLGSETIDSNWLNQGPTIKVNGVQSYTKTINATSPTSSVSISLSYVGIGAGISISTSGSHNVSTSMTQTLNQGTYQPQYKRRRDVYEVRQSQYYYEFGKSKLVSRKIGIIKFSAHAEWRFLKK